MEAENLLKDLCARHGVDPARGARLLPLVRWALKGPDDARERILAVVEKTLRVRDESGIDKTQEEIDEDADRAVMLSVAKILHTWQPEERILELGLSDDADEGPNPLG